MSSWDRSWEKVFQEREWGKYPNEDLIRFIASLYKPLGSEERKRIKVLEVGCGPGAQVWYLAREGFCAYGVDGSETAIQMCKQRLKDEGLSAEVTVGDIVKLPYPEEFFDAVIDVAATQHNTPENIAIIFSEIHRVLKTNGSFFSLMRSTRDYLFGHGREIAENTFTDIPIGDAKGIGVIHFFTIPEIKNLLKGEFKEFTLEYTERTIESMSYAIAHYIVTARK